MTDLDESVPADPKRQRLLELLERKQAQSALRPHELSYGQRGLWYLYQLAPDSPVYNVSWIWRITPCIDVSRLSAALSELIDRHPMLRTRFGDDERGPFQWVEPAPALALEEISAEAWSREEFQQRLAELARQPFDLRRGPVLRFHLFRVSASEHALLSVVHHIAADLWSSVLMLGEFQLIYEAREAGRRPQLPAPRAEYIDYVDFQNRLLTSAEGERHWAYWRDKLAGELPESELPTDRPRGAVQTFHGHALPFQVGPDSTEQLKALAQRENATLLIPLLSALYVLLHRYTGQHDIIIGSMGACRGKSEFQRVVGFFANLLPLRVEVSGQASFRELMRKVEETVLEAIEHEQFPFPVLAQRLGSQRSPGRPPLCNVIIQINAQQVDLVPEASRLEESADASTMGRLRVGDSTLSLVELDQPIAKMDLGLVILRTAGTLSGRLELNSDLFERETGRRFLGHYLNLLEAAIAEPDRPIAHLPMLSEPERQKLLHGWNFDSAYPREQSLAELFSRAAAARPEACAVRWQGRELTYAELDRRANRLAHYLQALGVAPEVTVGVCLERSIEMLVAWLGVIKAGGAYVPLDPDYPAERLAFLLSDSGAKRVLTRTELAPLLAAAAPDALICLDRAQADIDRESDAAPACRATGASLAYLIYTSGSTGKPKGIAIEQRGVSRLVLDTNYIQFRSDDRVAQAANASFDISTFEVWGALLNGACLVGLPKTVVLSLPDLARALAEERISVLLLPTALFNQVAREQPSAFAGVRELLFGGEVVEPRWVRTVLAADPPEHLVHVYGPTESTVLASTQLVREVAEDATTVSIGTPIGNTQIYVLDAYREPVPVGVPGELYIGGDGVARGYHNRPELTESHFVPDPFSGREGARLYRTGDRVFVRPGDGTLEFLGRRDFQVKLRGFRIELGEVEFALGQHPDVAQAVALVRPDPSGERQLVAYVAARVRDGAPSLNAIELRRYLRTKLPEYMMPSAFVVLEALPLNANGKLDRAALPAPERQRAANTADVAAPRTQLEQVLARVWAELLHLDQVGIHDNFFELGGHSLLAVRLFARLADELGERPPLAALYEAPTVAELANLLQRRTAGSGTGLLPLRTGGSAPPLFCIPGLVGTGFAFIDLARRMGAGRPFYALQSRGLRGEMTDLPATIEAIAREHLDAMRSVQPHGPYYLTGYSLGGSVAYDMARQLLESGERVAFLAMLDSACPAFALDESPIASGDWDALVAAMGVALDGPTLERMLAHGFDGLREEEQETVLSAGLGPPGIGPEEMRPLVQLLQVNLAAFFCYRPPPLPCAVTYFRAEQALASERLRGSDRDWARLAPLELHVVPGAHHNMAQEPHVAVLAERMRDCLKRVT